MNNYVINRDIIDKYIKSSKIISKKIHSIPKIGSVNGLYATIMGIGGVIPILIYRIMDNNNEHFN